MTANASVLILTKDEQQDLPSCLRSVAWCDDIHVYDSGSTDSTLDIARSYGAHITSRTYGDDERLFGGDEAAHRNWGLQNIRFKHEWVLQIDADERVTPTLRQAIAQALLQPSGCVAFRLRRRDFLGDTWLRHVQTSPYYLRLFRPEKMRLDRVINPTYIPDGPVGSIEGYLDHYPFSKGIAHWLDRHNAYSSAEAAQIVSNRERQSTFSVVNAFVAKDFHERRLHQKELFFRLPLRPFVKFLLLYVGKRGFLDGRAGVTYAVLQSIYEYMIVLKVREHEQRLDTATE